MPTRVSRAVTRPSNPVSSISSMTSTSEVSREITRPEVYLSWNDGLSRWKWSKTRRRRPSRMVWPSRPDRIRKICRVNGLQQRLARTAISTIVISV